MNSTSPRPLDGVRILAIEQMLALPYATQLLGFLGADVVKVEPLGGDSGRASRPLLEPDGEALGAVFARGNLGKRSIAVDLKSDRGRELVLRLVAGFDIVAENLRPGALERLGLGFDALVAARPDVVLLRVSGFGSLADSPYRSWPAYGPVVESMSGLSTLGRTAATAHPPGAFGALGDIAGGVFAACSRRCRRWPHCASATTPGCLSTPMSR
jgi:crotonobetainyl-CoA:carnitine CoA-transferase CaiB-like acyl-CoA transferase